MNAKKLAALLNGRQCGEEITKQEESLARAFELIVIFGYSDDNIELRGAITEEISMYGGGVIHLHRDGVMPDFEDYECDVCKARAQKTANLCAKIKCLWDDEGYAWFIVPENVSFVPFDIMEDVDKFCRGVVIEAKHLPVVNI